MSWGYRITILYLGFVGIIITLVTISSRNKEELVSKDYYKQELLYQEKLDAINNEKSLSLSIEHEVNASAIIIRFPSYKKGKVSGEINFFCSANSKNDKTVKMNFNDEGVQIISRKDLNKGIYKMQFSWKMENKNYFREEIVTVK